MGARRGQAQGRCGVGQCRAGLGLFLAGRSGSGRSGGLVTVAGQAPSVGQRDHLDPVGVVACLFHVSASALAVLAALMLGSSRAGLVGCLLPRLMSLPDPTARVTLGRRAWRSLPQR